MSIITSRFGTGGANIPPGKEQGTPSLADVFRDIADDLQGHQPLLITSPNAIDLATTETLVNEIKAKLNAIAPAKGSVRGTVLAPFVITDGLTLIYAVDGGAPITSTFHGTQAIKTGSVGPFDMRGTPNLKLLVNGHDNGGKAFNVSFPPSAFADPANATSTEVAAVLSAAISGTLATFANSAGALRMTAVRRGIGSAIQVTGGNARGPLGFDLLEVKGTGDAFDIAAMTVAEVNARIDADSTAEVLDVAGRCLLRTTTAGTGGSIHVTGGTAQAALGLTDTSTYAGSAGVASLTAKG